MYPGEQNFSSVSGYGAAYANNWHIETRAPMLPTSVAGGAAAQPWNHGGGAPQQLYPSVAGAQPQAWGNGTGVPQQLYSPMAGAASQTPVLYTGAGVPQQLYSPVAAAQPQVLVNRTGAPQQEYYPVAGAQPQTLLTGTGAPQQEYYPVAGAQPQTLLTGTGAPQYVYSPAAAAQPQVWNHGAVASQQGYYPVAAAQQQVWNPATGASQPVYSPMTGAAPQTPVSYTGTVVPQHVYSPMTAAQPQIWNNGTVASQPVYSPVTGTQPQTFVNGTVASQPVYSPVTGTQPQGWDNGAGVPQQLYTTVAGAQPQGWDNGAGVPQQLYTTVAGAQPQTFVNGAVAPPQVYTTVAGAQPQTFVNGAVAPQPVYSPVAGAQPQGWDNGAGVPQQLYPPVPAAQPQAFVNGTVASQPVYPPMPGTQPQVMYNGTGSSQQLYPPIKSGAAVTQPQGYGLYQPQQHSNVQPPAAPQPLALQVIEGPSNRPNKVYVPKPFHRGRGTGTLHPAPTHCNEKPRNQNATHQHVKKVGNLVSGPGDNKQVFKQSAKPSDKKTGNQKQPTNITQSEQPNDVEECNKEEEEEEEEEEEAAPTTTKMPPKEMELLTNLHKITCPSDIEVFVYTIEVTNLQGEKIYEPRWCKQDRKKFETALAGAFNLPSFRILQYFRLILLEKREFEPKSIELQLSYEFTEVLNFKIKFSNNTVLNTTYEQDSGQQSMFWAIFQYLLEKNLVKFEISYFDFANAGGAVRAGDRLTRLAWGLQLQMMRTEMLNYVSVHQRPRQVLARDQVGIRLLDLVLAEVGGKVFSHPALLATFLNKRAVFARNKLRIYTEVGGNKLDYAMNKFVRETAEKCTFLSGPPDQAGSRSFTVAAYFLERHNVQVDWTLPLVQTSHRQHLPLELCYLEPNQVVHTERTLRLRSATEPALPVAEYLARGIGHAQDINTYIEAVHLDIHLDHHPLTIRGKQLAAFKEAKCEKAFPIEITCTCVSFRHSRREEARQYFANIIGAGEQQMLKLFVAEDQIHTMSYNHDQIRPGEALLPQLTPLFEALAPNGSERRRLLLVCIPEDCEVYHIIQYLGNFFFGVQTLCVTEMPDEREPAAEYFERIGCKIRLRFEQVSYQVRAPAKFWPTLQDTAVIGVYVFDNDYGHKIISAVAAIKLKQRFPYYINAHTVITNTELDPAGVNAEVRRQVLTVFRRVHSKFVQLRSAKNTDGTIDVTRKQKITKAIVYFGESETLKLRFPDIATKLREVNPGCQFLMLNCTRNHDVHIAQVPGPDGQVSGAIAAGVFVENSILEARGGTGAGEEDDDGEGENEKEEMKTRRAKPNFPSDVGAESQRARPDRSFYLNSRPFSEEHSRVTHYSILEDTLFNDLPQVIELTFFLCHGHSYLEQQFAVPEVLHYAELAARKLAIIKEGGRNLGPQVVHFTCELRDECLKHNYHRYYESRVGANNRPEHNTNNTQQPARERNISNGFYWKLHPFMKKKRYYLD